MKAIKRIMAVLLSAVMLFSMAACGSTEKTDSEYVKEKGVLVVGITDFDPMDYQNDNGEWIGYDADLAKAFAESLGVKVEFLEIDWGKKTLELDGKTIDVVWNGMTLTDAVKAAMSTSNAYCTNAQVIVMNKANAEKYKDVSEMKELMFAVEDVSAGEEVASDNGFKVTEVLSQADALMEVAAGTCDAAIIDLLMAGAMVGEGTGYSDLVYTVSLNSEQYGVGFRKGSDLTEKLNEFFEKAYADGTMEKLADTYKIAKDCIIEQ